MTATARKPRHHHGNLREALVMAGVQLLEDGGPEALTLRGCAALAGVSHAAPAHHFGGLEMLKAAIAAEGYRRFRNYMVDAEVTGPQTPRGRLKSICRGYMNFAADNPALFDLVFGYDLNQIPKPGLLDTGSFAYQVLRRAAAPFVPKGTDPVVIEAQIWALVHGFATLSLAGRFRIHNAVPDAALFDAVMGLLDRVGDPG